MFKKPVIMANNNGKIDFGIIVLVLFITLLIIFYNFKPFLAFLPLVFLLAPVIFFIAFTNTDFALILLIFSMLLSPEIDLGGVKGREIVVRLDDILLFVVFFGWFAKTAVNKELGLFRATLVNKWIGLYILIYIIATLLGILNSTVKWQESLLYSFKYFEYFLVYFMVVNSLKDRRQVEVFVFMMIFVAVITSGYAWYEHFKGIERVSAPFEGKTGEANTLGGYLLLIMMVATGLILNVTSLNTKILLMGSLCIIFPAFLFTLSRSSWFSFVPAYIVLMFLSRKGKHTLFITSLLFIFLFSAIFPAYVYKRIQSTFENQSQRTMMGRKVYIDASAAARIDTYREGFRLWAKAPVLGHGAGSAGAIVDNYYSRVLIEAGAIGLIAFIILMRVLTRSALLNLKKLKDDHFSQGMIAGFIAGLTGLLVHSLGGATFILIRIMEPFWFLAAIVIMLPEIEKESTLNRG